MFFDGWCNGGAGLTMLYTLGAPVLSSTDLTESAVDAASACWQSETQVGSLCCGLRGMATRTWRLTALPASAPGSTEPMPQTGRSTTDPTSTTRDHSLFKGRAGLMSMASCRSTSSPCCATFKTHCGQACPSMSLLASCSTHDTEDRAIQGIGA